MLTGIFVLTEPLKAEETDFRSPLFQACLSADIQYLYGCKNVADLFSKIENFMFQNPEISSQILVIIPPRENLILLLREEYPNIKLIFWGREIPDQSFLLHWQPIIAGRYHYQNDITQIVVAIEQLIMD